MSSGGIIDIWKNKLQKLVNIGDKDIIQNCLAQRKNFAKGNVTLEFSQELQGAKPLPISLVRQTAMRLLVPFYRLTPYSLALACDKARNNSASCALSSCLLAMAIMASYNCRIKHEITIEVEEDEGSHQSRALIAIQKRLIFGEVEGIRRRHVKQIRMEIRAAETRLRHG